MHSCLDSFQGHFWTGRNLAKSCRIGMPVSSGLSNPRVPLLNMMQPVRIFSLFLHSQSRILTKRFPQKGKVSVNAADGSLASEGPIPAQALTFWWPGAD